MASVSSFFVNNWIKIKDYGASVLGVGFATKGATETAQYIHKTEVKKARHREIRRFDCRKEVKELKNQKMEPAEEQAEMDNILTAYTLSSLDDNQNVDNICQDLSLTGSIPQNHQPIIVLGPKQHLINHLPGFPSNYKGFLLGLKNPAGEVRILNNPLNLSLPVSVSTNSTQSPGSSGPNSPGTSSFASINKGFSGQQNVYSVTTYNPKTNKVSTEIVKAGDLFKGKKVFFKGEEVVITRQGTIERVQGTNECVQGTNECAQGVNPNATPVFTRFEGKASTATSVGILFAQLMLIWAFSLPLLEFSQNIIRQRFFENKKVSKTEKEIMSEKGDEKRKPEKGGQKD